MKTLALLVSLLIVSSSFAQNPGSQKNADITFEEIKYGIARVQRESTEKLKKSPTGTRNYLSDFIIASVTDSIPAVLNTSFGVEYILRSEGAEDIDIDIEWIFPRKIKNEEGKKFKSLRYTTQRFANEPTFSSYSLEKPYEVVKGEWKINIYTGNKLLYTRTFILF